MITTICMNPSFDKTVQVDHMQLCEVNRIRTSRIDPGGKGINVAVAAHRLESEIQCLGIMGQDGSEQLKQLLDKEKLNYDFLIVSGRIRTNLKIVSRDGNGVTELNEPGVEINETVLQNFYKLCKEKTADSKIIVLTGSIPPGCGEGTYRRMIDELGEKKCILDVEGQELIEGVKAHPFMIKPNLQELESTLHTELSTLRSVREAAMFFINQGIENVIVSMGAKGALFINSVKTIFAPPVNVPVKSTVGAGDSMIGGFVTGYEKTNNVYEAFRYGVAAGTASVMTEGTQLIEKEHFEKILERVIIRDIS